MDPYLEESGIWPGFHNWLIAALGEDLSPRVRPRYYVALEERVYIAEPLGEPPGLIGVPDAVAVPAGPAHPLPAAATAASAPAAVHPADGAGPGVLVAVLPGPARVRDTYLEVRETRTADVVTLIEVLCPTNKRPGEGRRDLAAGVR